MLFSKNQVTLKNEVLLGKKKMGKGECSPKRPNGFTLIELLIVIAIIGILSTIVIPNVMVSINRAKQKSTMKDIATLSSAITSYITDNGTMSAQNGSYDTSTTFYKALCPFYIRVLPINDQWGNGFQVWIGTSATQYGISNPEPEDHIVASFGRDNEQEDDFTFDPSSPEAGFFILRKMIHFNNDLIMLNGIWIRGPGAPSSGKGC